MIRLHALLNLTAGLLVDASGIVVSPGVQLVSDAAFVNERFAGSISFKDLNSVATDRVKLVVVNQQSLWPAPA